MTDPQDTDQTRHEAPTKWPKPMAAGLLVELDVGKRESNIVLPGGDLFNLNSGTVRATSPELPDDIAQEFLPDGAGSFGKRVIAPEASLTYFEDHVYERLDLTVPDTEENEYGELVLVDIRRIIATIPEDLDDMNPPFAPLGDRVFLEFDYDDTSADVVGTESGKTYGPEDGPDEGSELVVPESAMAQQNNLATVTKAGPEAEHVSDGDRVIPPAICDSITYQGEEYFFVQTESDLVALL